MYYHISQIFIILFILLSCQTGRLTLVADLPNSLDEISAVETLKGSQLIWVIEDAGNKNNVYGVNKKGKIIRDLNLTNAKNEDWEDLTSDKKGNIYIGDFGNNSKKRDVFSILKINILNKNQSDLQAHIIEFKLPKKTKSQDFEGFFIYNDNFYIFSKDDKESMLFKVPNQMGKHEAKLISKLKLKGKNTSITSADISDDGKTVLLLNHDKLFKLTGFKGDDFFSGQKETITFAHDSQKEGICFNQDSKIYITDERNGNSGGNLYELDLENLEIQAKSK